MTKAEYTAYIQAPHWQQRRLLAIEDAGEECERCSMPRWLATQVYDQDLHVHHLSYKHLGDEQREDLEVLCRRCHEIQHFGSTEQKALKRVKCSLCRASHYNTYSKYCQKCITAISLRQVIELQKRKPVKKDRGDQGNLFPMSGTDSQ